MANESADVLTGSRHRELAEFDDPPDDPVALLCAWLDEAVADEVPLPQAMVLATVAPDEGPMTRTVAVKRWDERGLVFGTNLGSRKVRHLDADPRAAGTFHWPDRLQQINVAGQVERTDEAESDALFLERPAEARASAIASRQSEVLDDEAALHAAADAALRADEVTARPASWGGLLLRPNRIEFWQGSHDRLHRRLEYVHDGERWSSHRLQP
jgi:dihydrophenazinedicarboxylate synthase